jgi:hypothetical protein
MIVDVQPFIYEPSYCPVSVTYSVFNIDTQSSPSFIVFDSTLPSINVDTLDTSLVGDYNIGVQATATLNNKNVMATL